MKYIVKYIVKYSAFQAKDCFPAFGGKTILYTNLLLYLAKVPCRYMPRIPLLTYERGTLILHPPPKGKAWIEFATWDDRIEKFRIPANRYRELILTL